MDLALATVYTNNDTGKVDILLNCTATGINPLPVRSKQLILYPNPNKGMFTIEMNSAQGIAEEIEFYNMLGEKVYSDAELLPRELIVQKLSVPNAERVFFIRHALRAGLSVEEIFQLSRIDRWFLAQIKELADFEAELSAAKS